MKGETDTLARHEQHTHGILQTYNAGGLRMTTIRTLWVGYGYGSCARARRICLDAVVVVDSDVDVVGSLSFSNDAWTPENSRSVVVHIVIVVIIIIVIVVTVAVAHYHDRLRRRRR